MFYFKLGVFVAFFFHRSQCLTLTKETAIYNNPIAMGVVNNDCDSSTIPVMASFDIEKFSGKWFELAKTSAGYIDVSDGVWLIGGNNTSKIFRFSGRDNNGHCIRPLKGQITASLEPPGLLNLNYKTYSTHVKETIRVLFTDYESMAVIYTCMHHVHQDKEMCHAAGLFGAIWTRKEHVDVEVFEKATQYLEMACIHKSTLIIRNVIGPCRIEDLDPRIDDFPAPDYCYQPVDLGSCRGSIQRYYFDAKEKSCKMFKYGGCEGNKNNFMSLPECQKNCISDTQKDPVCMSVARCGLHCSPCCTEDKFGCVECNCEHIIEDNFLNCVRDPSQCPEECEVETFYEGCHVCRCRDYNALEELPPACNEVKAVGNCRAKIERFYYNPIVAQCQSFEYSGCNGNNNSFETLSECIEKCQQNNEWKRKLESPTVQKIPIDSPGSTAALTYNLMLICLTMMIVLKF
ncbi:hypothetical protein JTE90_013305 [Oedothorax gibbosus]|uniref:BPTI/Kunitz inhibitor domain-containing protein n=1 Tax=Oedothorax gibbosus TaxID=931172 RepID=A0AAV6VD22_9ARAC|nr:hypothetical protein JTE90_013305 [Oedothorax gibbosus]